MTVVYVSLIDQGASLLIGQLSTNVQLNNTIIYSCGPTMHVTSNVFITTALYT